jgi:RNA polymerase sigma-70 factor (ECF subfamily)
MRPTSGLANHQRGSQRRLAATDREVLTLAQWDGLTGDQVGALIGISATSARKRLQRAREGLTVILATTGKTAGHGHAAVVTADRS